MPSYVCINDLPALQLEHIYMRDEAAIVKSINTILQNGVDNLQVITDFDQTLTKQHINGKQVLSSFGIFGKSKQLPTTYTVEAKRLYQKYRPIEIDPHLPLDEKIEAMSDWMNAAQELLKGIEFDPAELDDIAKDYGTVLRDGAKDLFDKLNAAKVPILVFSAGLGDVVEAVLRYHGVLFENVKVISNFLKYKDGKLDGFKNSRLIHVFNKNEHAIEQDYFKVIERRKNVILMGDSTGDAGMVNGMENPHVVLKLGFLYDNAAKRLPMYMQEFDIVLVDDQTMKVTNEILKMIL